MALCPLTIATNVELPCGHVPEVEQSKDVKAMTILITFNIGYTLTYTRLNILIHHKEKSNTKEKRS